MKTKFTLSHQLKSVPFRKFFSIGFSSVLLIAATSCLENKVIDQNQESTTLLTAAQQFNYETSVKTPVTIVAKDFYDRTIGGVTFDLYYDNPLDGSSLRTDVTRVAQYRTNAQGEINTILDIPNIVKKAYLVANYPGYNNPIEITPSLSAVTTTVHPAGFGTVSLKSTRAATITTPSIVLGSNVYKIGDYVASTGVPLYKEAAVDTVGSAFLLRIANSLPEYKHVPVLHPEYLVDASKANIRTKEACNIYVTFVSEGAAYRNTLGYFYYPTASAPGASAAINKKVVIFPNASASGAGGGLTQGDKVKLLYFNETTQSWSDVFPANITIGWFLISDGYATGNIGNGRGWLYSIPSFNTYGMQQNVILFDKASSRMVIAFEDISRTSAYVSGDEDFNDAVFYATANPITAIDTDNLNVIGDNKDTDGDGVLNDDDQYPNDSKRAFNATYSGSLAFEDNWPVKGDYDFNDLVADYNVTHVTNAQNKVVDVKASFSIRSQGASFKNGFAFQLGTTPDNVDSLSGSILLDRLFTVNALGLESGQTKAVIPIVDNIYKLFNSNVIVNSAKLPDVGVVLPSQTVNIKVTFKTPVDLATLGTPPYNPFLVVDQNRGREVHLPGNLPTDLANLSLFGTADDRTSPSSGVYYKADFAYPWAINISGTSFAYPREFALIGITPPNITNNKYGAAYNFFNLWVTSNGQNYGNWYQDLSGYRNTDNLY